MTIRTKILLTVLIPVAGLLLFLGFNSYQMAQVTAEVEETVNDVFIPIVKKDIPEITALNDAIALLLNADRDAYQAYLAQVEAMDINDHEKLVRLDADNMENINQVNDRVNKSSSQFDKQMNAQYETFKEQFRVWKESSREVVKMSIELAENFKQRKELMSNSVAQFDLMRDAIDRIELLLEEKLKTVTDDNNITKSKLNDIYNSYSLLLNADRDAYQAYLAQMQAMQSNSPEEMLSIVKDNMSNIQQVSDRAEKASGVFDDDMNLVYKEFKGYYEQWQKNSIAVVDLSSRSIDNKIARNESSKNSLVAFDIFRDTINAMTEMFEKRIGDQVVYINDISEKASVKSKEMCDSMKSDVKYSSIAGIVISIFSVIISILVCKAIIVVLQKAIDSMTVSSEQVASASTEVSSTSQALANGSCEQAAGIEQITSSMSQISDQTNENVENARQAHQYAQEVNASTISGTEAMEQMSAAIHDIQKSSEETSKIVKTIDEIAFQTNLLALNAAVEAARAGEAGKGFAVVAEEVRNLAMRSAEAARSTTEMIEESVKNANNGVEIVSRVGSVLNEIAESVDKTTTYVSNITTSNDEQAAAINQIRDAIAQMDGVTQSNATAAEESASAAEELNAQAETVNEIVHNLAKMVGGDSSNRKTVKTKLPHNDISVPKLSRSDKAFHEIAGSSPSAPIEKEPVKHVATTSAANAEEAIPFENDDFDEFN